MRPFDCFGCYWFHYEGDTSYCTWYKYNREGFKLGKIKQIKLIKMSNAMKKIEKRAKEYSLKDFDGYYTGREKAVEEGYIAGAGEQKHLTLEAFDEWLCRNSWITRDENNRQPLAELRSIIEHI